MYRRIHISQPHHLRLTAIASFTHTHGRQAHMMTKLRSFLRSSTTSALTLSSLSLSVGFTSSFVTSAITHPAHHHCSHHAFQPSSIVSSTPAIFRFASSESNNGNGNSNSKISLNMAQAESATADAKVQTATSDEMGAALDESNTIWNDLLPYEKGSHNSARIVVPDHHQQQQQQCDQQEDPTDGDTACIDAFDKSQFQQRLANTIAAMKEIGKSSLWVEIPMTRASLIEDMNALGFEFHHAQGKTAKLNLWLKDATESKVPEYATHHVGVGAVVINSRDEILCVRELRRNFMPWKIPGGLADLGEHIAEAAQREVLEETGIDATFHSILSFRHTHGLGNGRSDLYFVCRLDPVEVVDEAGVAMIPAPVPQECEIESAAWIPMQQYKDMVRGNDGGSGHPMMSHVMDVLETGMQIRKRTVHSVVPGRKPNPMYHPCVTEE